MTIIKTVALAIRYGEIFVLAALLSAAPPAWAEPSGQPPQTLRSPPCDRACLVGFADAYFAAALKHSPQGLALSPTVRMTENTEPLPIGDGVLWHGLDQLPGTFRFNVVDPQSGQIAVNAVLLIGSQKYLAVVRLKVEDGAISEVEQLLSSFIQNAALPNLVRPRLALLTDVPAAKKNNRADMVSLAGSYFDALTHDDSRLTRLATDCVRHETGIRMTGNAVAPKLFLPPAIKADQQALMRKLFAIHSLRSCGQQIDSGMFADLKIAPRRILVVDEQKGLVAAFPMFIQTGQVRPTPLKGFPGIERLPTPLPSTSQWTEVFKIHSGEIHEIEALMFVQLNYGAGNGWTEGSGR
ncbi:MAG TPA: hypothetical protein VFT56_10105 [Sphingomonas sp.]|nr:hypothetical protein [Sphingomonas sp.]